MALSLSACQTAQPQPLLSPAPLPQMERLRVYMNQREMASYSDPYRSQQRAGDDLEQVIIEAIATAQSTIDVAVQEIRLPRIAVALAERHQAGVKVRVMLENIYARPYSQYTPEQIAQLPQREQDRYAEAHRLIDLDGDGSLSPTEIEQRDALVILDRAQIPRRDDTADGSAGSNLMHHKFMVVDGRTVISTSANWTMSDIHGDIKTPKSRGNANNLLKIDSPELANLFTQEFNFLWGNGLNKRSSSRFGIQKPHRPAQLLKVEDALVQVQFSPSRRAIPWEQSSNGLIGRTLQRAQEQIDLALFVFSDQKLVNLLEPVQQSGVELRALIDPGFAFRPYSEGLDMLGITLADQDCRLEAGNRPWQQPIYSVGVPRLPPGDLLHHKFGVIDRRIVITGSHNWTEAANHGNDETVLVIYHPVVAAHFQQEFERLYRDAVVGVPPAIRKKADQQRRECPQILTRAAATRSPEFAKRTASSAARPLTQTQAQKRGAAKSGKSLFEGKPLNLNTATQKELESLPGIGPKLAQRIIAARQKRPLRSLQDLQRIPGISPQTLKRLEGNITW